MFREESMAGEPWNRVNIPFPGAASCVRIHFNQNTDVNVRNVLMGSENVLKLLRSEILQTEIRVLYELLHILTNNFRGNKTFKALKQVEQCVNRLKDMKLSEALDDLADVCPKRTQRALSIKAGDCDVPSQPTLEWICLKVLGAAELMSCTLGRCSRAFIRSRQQMKWDEFIILNLVIASMLSRLWVLFRGVLTSLVTLYQQLLELLKEVAHAHPMPFLTGFSLPADMTQILGPFDSSLPIEQPRQRKEKKKKAPVKIPSQERRRTAAVDLGVTVQRDQLTDNNTRPYPNILKVLKEDQQEVEKKNIFRKRVRAATSFTEMITHLQKMTQWCKSKKLEKERRCLSFLHLKCQKMKCLEAAGYNVQMKLRRCKREAYWASSPRGSAPKTGRRFASARRGARLRTRVQLLKSRLRFSTVRIGIENKKTKKQSKRTSLPESSLTDISVAKRTSHEATPQPSDCERDDIDDIFAFVGW